jgi:uncharacterized membrane protein YraQ (UPF0718 family)
MNEENIKKTKSKKGWQWIIIILIVILAAVIGYYYGYSQKNYQPTETPSVSEEGREIQDFGDVPPDIFPLDFPFEVGSSLSESKKITYKDSGAIQAQVVYFSKKPVEQSADRFQEYLTQTGWTIINNTNDMGIYSLYAQKDKAIMNIVMQNDALTNQVRIEANYVINK